MCSICSDGHGDLGLLKFEVLSYNFFFFFVCISHDLSMERRMGIFRKTTPGV